MRRRDGLWRERPLSGGNGGFGSSSISRGIWSGKELGVNARPGLLCISINGVLIIKRSVNWTLWTWWCEDTHSVARDDTPEVPPVDGLGISGHGTGKNQRSGEKRGGAQEYVHLILALTPDEVLMELGGGIELLGEETSLTLLGLGVLLGGGQVEDQVGDNEGLRRLVKPGDILLAEAREVDSVDLFGTIGIRNKFAEIHLGLRSLTSASKPKLFSSPGL
jgi:hypothetical protein